MKKILVIGPAWIGDMVMAQCLFKALHQQGAEVHVLAPTFTHDIISMMPEVSAQKVLPLKHGELKLRERYRVAKTLRKEGYDQAIVLPRSFKAALIPYWANIPQRTGFLGESRYGVLNDRRPLDKNAMPLMVQRLLALGETACGNRLPEGLRPQLVVDETTLTITQAKFSLDDTRPFLALCPGAEYGPAKRWPTRHFASLATWAIQQGYDVGLFGSHKESGLAEEITAMTQGSLRDFTGKTRLTEAVALLSRATAVVSNDSGLMHIAAALQRSLVAVYGSSSPTYTPPLTDRVFIAKTALPCQPCYQRECPLQHGDCLKTLAPTHIIPALADFMSCPTE